MRRWIEDPVRILAPYVKEGMTVLEPGPGMGFFTLELARRVGPAGRVVAIDIQPRMLAALRRKAEKAGLADRLVTRLAAADSLGIQDLAGTVDFCFAFAMVHEMPDAGRFFDEAAKALKPGASILLAEPSGHVEDADFAAELELAAARGFSLTARPKISRSHSALLRRE